MTDPEALLVEKKRLAKITDLQAFVGPLAMDLMELEETIHEYAARPNRGVPKAPDAVDRGEDEVASLIGCAVRTGRRNNWLNEAATQMDKLNQALLAAEAQERVEE